LSGPLPQFGRETQQFPVVQRASIRFFRRVTRWWVGLFRDVGVRSYFVRDIARALGDPATYIPETIRQMKNIGVDSIPITLVVAAFIGGVIALQTRYQLFPGVELSIIGLASRLMVVLELGPLLTGLVLTGRVGGRMTAEIGTMRVTEQIDALETLAYDPVAFLIVPRVLAATFMLPTLVILADATGLVSAYTVSVRITDVTPQDFITGLVKAGVFGALISGLACHLGLGVTGGAQGVGTATTRTVVYTIVALITVDLLFTAVFYYLGF